MTNAMIKAQNFGTEIEFTGITRAVAARVIAKVLNSTASRGDSTNYNTRTILDSKNRTWKLMRDSSIRPEGYTSSSNYENYKCELVTPILQYEDIETLQNIVRALRKAGAVANTSCGIHVHIDGANHDAKSVRRMVRFFEGRQDLVYEGLQIADCRKNRWCKPISTELYKAMMDIKNPSKGSIEDIWYSDKNDGYVDYRPSRTAHYNTTRYHGLNLHAWFTKGTIEFRLFNGTMHAGKIKAYIQFCLALSGWAITCKSSVSFHKEAFATVGARAKAWKSILENRFGLVGDEFKTAMKFLMIGFTNENEAEIEAA